MEQKCSLGKQFLGLPQAQPAEWRLVLQQSHHATELGNAQIELSHTVQQPHSHVPLGHVFEPVRHWHVTDVVAPLHEGVPS